MTLVAWRIAIAFTIELKLSLCYCCCCSVKVIAILQLQLFCASQAYYLIDQLCALSASGRIMSHIASVNAMPSGAKDFRTIVNVVVGIVSVHRVRRRSVVIRYTACSHNIYNILNIMVANGVKRVRYNVSTVDDDNDNDNCTTMGRIHTTIQLLSFR